MGSFLITPQDPDNAKWLSEHKVLDNISCVNQLKDCHFIFMELPKFNINIDQLINSNEKWTYFFKHVQDSTFEEMEHLISQDIVIKRVFQAIDQASWPDYLLRVKIFSTIHQQCLVLKNCLILTEG